MESNEYASEKLKKLRTRKNLTQQELAEDLNIDQRQISRYESGQRQFKPDFLTKLSEYFNVPVSEFFSEELETAKQTLFLPVYDDLTFKKISEHIEVPKSWFKTNKNVFCIKLNGDIVLYKKDENDYLIFEKKKKEKI